VPLENDIQKYLTNFSLITHGFGTPAMVAVFSSFKRYLISMKSNYEKIINGSSSSSSSTQNFINSQNFHNLIPTNQSQLQKQQQYFNINSTGATSSSSSSSSSSTSSTPSSTSVTSSSSSSRMINNNELGILKIEHKD
jgi:hypothetical protein